MKTNRVFSVIRKVDNVDIFLLFNFENKLDKGINFIISISAS